MVSIWSPTEVTGERVFVRPPVGPFGDHYAARRTVPACAPPGTRRLCLLGESVAAGYLYAPHVTPATILGRLLGEAWDVVDLARTNETLDGLVATATAATRELAPDRLVLFAGNNWNLLETPEVSPYHPAGRAEYAEALREGGAAGPIELAGRRRLRRAGAALATIAGLGVPIVLVVPAVDRRRWEARQPPVWLAGDGTARWHRHYGSAIDALRRDDDAAARRHAEQMIELDGGTNPSPFRLLAAAGVGAAAEAEVAADHYATMCFLGAPRAAPIDQELQRRAAQRHGFRLVDLPALFDGDSPFLDYCHLTARGMGVAMAAVAAEVAGRDVAPIEPDVPAAVEATARLGAAIHTAHRHLPVDVRRDRVGDRLREALASDPGVTDALFDVIAARSAAAPEVLTPAQQRNRASSHRLGYQHGWRFDHLDAALVDAARRLYGEEVDALLAPVGEAPVELVPEYLWEPAARIHAEVTPFADVTVPAFLRCPWPTVSLAFVAAAPADHVVDVTARLAPFCAPGAAQVTVNGRAIGRFALGHRWSSGSLQLPGEAVMAGLNRLDVTWPPLPPVGDVALEQAIGRLARGVPADVHPIFGELWSARVRRGRPQ